jgi:NAD(P)-dependent dehydrogenase (short-subunit alcohol dehydrogenase family)
VPRRHARSRFDLAGAVTVVTGASSGLGRRFAEDLADAGAVVVGVARRQALLEEVEARLRDRSPGSSTRVCDVADTDAFRALLADAERSFGRIDVLVNCAGVGEPRLEQGIDKYRLVMDINYFGPVAGTLAVLPGMLERRRGVVVNVSSDSGRAPGPGEPAYGPSKAALSAFTEAMAMRVAGTGVLLHVLYPGWVPTAMGSGAVEQGMPMPPKAVRRTETQVSRLLLSHLGSDKLDIDAAAVAKLAPVARALFPRLYRRGLRAASGAGAAETPSGVTSP